MHEVVIGRISVHSDYAARVALFRFLLLSSSDCHRGPKEVFVPALVASRGAVHRHHKWEEPEVLRSAPTVPVELPGDPLTERPPTSLQHRLS